MTYFLNLRRRSMRNKLLLILVAMTVLATTAIVLVILNQNHGPSKSACLAVMKQEVRTTIESGWLRNPTPSSYQAPKACQGFSDKELIQLAYRAVEEVYT